MSKLLRLLACGAFCAALVIATNTGQAAAKNAVAKNVDTANAPNPSAALASEGESLGAAYNANAPAGVVAPKVSAAENSIALIVVNQEAAPNANAGTPAKKLDANGPNANAPNQEAAGQIAVVAVVAFNPLL